MEETLQQQLALLRSTQQQHSSIQVKKQVSPPPPKCHIPRREALAALALAAASPNPARALIQTGLERDSRNPIQNLKKRVSTFKLANGMKWIVLQRRNAPIISCHTYASVGAADEPEGLTGIAHLLEHLAFKGTKRVGSRNPELESAALDHLDELFYALREARSSNNLQLAQKLAEELKQTQAEVSKTLSLASEYGSMIERQGGVQLNAQTSHDSTEYFVSLPANKLELWMALESGRFIAPVFRDLYAEKEVVKEERRLRVENSPYGRFTQAFTEAAFPGRAYGRPVIGYPQDFESIGRREVTEFFTKNYTPCRLTCAVVGDIDSDVVEKMAVKYFGSWSTPCSSDEVDESKLWRIANGWEDSAPPIRPKDLFTMASPAQPLYMEGYYRPASWSCDDPAISVISDLLSGGRVSRFYKRLIAPRRLLSAESVSSFPGDRYPCLFLLYGSPPTGIAQTKTVSNLLHRQLEELCTRGVKEEELIPVRKSTRASLLEALGSNSAMARILSTYHATTGSWTRILEETEEIESVSKIDVARVATKLLDPEMYTSMNKVPVFDGYIVYN